MYITGRPTPDTRKHRLDGAPTTDNNNDDGAKLETYDLVCCSVRMLEDAPLVEPELVGKGDEWTGGGDYLEMDLEESAVVYVDSAKRLKEMGEFLRKVGATRMRRGRGVRHRVRGGTDRARCVGSDGLVAEEGFPTVSVRCIFGSMKRPGDSRGAL